ncbi:MAG: vWA domain-containing protein [Panacagrimonas sp.]
MTLEFVNPWLLPVALIALVPLLWHGVREFAYPSLAWWPPDLASRVMAIGLRALAALAVALLIAAAAGPYLEGGTVTRVGRGAQIVVVFDRSGSMSEMLTTSYDEVGGESKIAAARRLLLEFMRQRKGDMFGMVAFGSSPIAVAPLTEDRAVAEAAIASAEVRSFGFTQVGRALALGLDYFRDKPFTGSRLVLLISDGGAEIGAEDRRLLEALFLARRVSLVWIYARGAREESVIVDVKEGELSQSLSMHRFFGALGIPYQVFEATNPDGFQRAIAEVGRMTNLPTRYEERLPRQDLAQPLFTAGLVLIGLLIGAKLFEVRRWIA